MALYLLAGMAGILATGRAPAYAKATTVHWLRWNDFVPASDQLLRKELLESVRTFRLPVVAGLFLFVGLSSPVLARYLPEIIELAGGDQLGASGDAGDHDAQHVVTGRRL